MQFSPYALITFAATIVSAWLAYAIWSRRPGAGVTSFVVLALSITEWALFSGVELLLTDAKLITLATQMTYLGITAVPAAWLVFTLQYTGHDKWITRRTLLLFLIEPILVQILISTNSLHHVFWTSLELVVIEGYTGLVNTYGWAFWAHAAYSYLLLIMGTALLLRAFIRSPHLYRGQALYLSIASLSPWVANVITLTGLSPLPRYVDLTPLSFVIAAAATAWSLFHFRLMDIVPIGRETIIDNMEDAIFILDSSNRIVDINHAALQAIHQQADDVIGHPAIEVLADQQTVVEQFRTTAEANADVTLTLEGLSRAFNLRITPLRNRQKELIGRIVVLHDISTLKETNRQLQLATERAEEATRLKSQFLATMSHELRTPLNAIIGYTELQLMGMVGDLSDQQYEYQERVLANSKHLLRLINDILDLSKIEAGRMELVKKPFVLRTWIDEIVRENGILAQEKGLAFKTDIAAEMPDTLIGDSVRIRQIVVNLISNSIKFTKTGSISVTLRPDADGTWAIIVADTGVGISPHKQETIFTEFYQLDNSSTREYAGTGLGLAIVRRLVMAMGGNIRVSSALGEGSTFTVTLPLVVEQQVATTNVA